MNHKPSATPPTYHFSLHFLAILLTIATFLLLALGGTVTSRNAGLSVPDWPTTFRHNMFTVPLNLWVGRSGVFWEHSHRLLGTAVGFIMFALAIGLWTTQRSRPWLRRLASIGLMLVVVQGVMGGLRVTQYPYDERLALVLAILHGIAGQLFLALAVVFAAATSRWWIASAAPAPASADPRPCTPAVLRQLRGALLILILSLIVQLALGAAMRHTQSGEAIPDFPASYGRLIPPLDQVAIAQAVAAQPAYMTPDVPTPAQVAVHFAHRLWAIVVVIATAWVVFALKKAADEPRLIRPAFFLVALMVLQLALGAMVVWTAVQPEFATAHQTVGAAILATAVLLAARAQVAEASPPRSQPVPLAAAPA